ncbi:hypothetical protein L2E82_50404 [Cichorium intybus]|nr:hypothetical protein L2E82_50404 [Cichorium intybus]
MKRIIRTRLFVKSFHSSLVFSSITIYLCGVDYTIRVKELCSWTPDFLVKHTDDEVMDSVRDKGSRDWEYNKESSLGFIVETIENALRDPLVNDEEEDVVMVFSNEGNIGEVKIDDDPFSGVSHDGAVMTGGMSHSLERAPAASMGSVPPMHGHSVSLGCSDAVKCQENHNSFSMYSDESPKQRFGFLLLINWKEQLK